MKFIKAPARAIVQAIEQRPDDWTQGKHTFNDRLTGVEIWTANSFIYPVMPHFHIGIWNAGKIRNAKNIKFNIVEKQYIYRAVRRWRKDYKLKNETPNIEEFANRMVFARDLHKQEQEKQYAEKAQAAPSFDQIYKQKLYEELRNIKVK